jgi:hypothetical protein
MRKRRDFGLTERIEGGLLECFPKIGPLAMAGFPLPEED